MSDEPRAYVLAEMTWPEFRDALSAIEVALIPVGSTEQHGPGGTFGVDHGRAEAFARRLAARLYPRAVSVPAVPYGVSPHHMRFPGTITLTPDVFIAVCEQIVDSLYAHGLRRFFFLNGHGGNRASLGVLLQKLMVKYEDARAAWTSFTTLAPQALAAHVRSPVSGHACEGELSQAMVLAPWAVREGAAGPGRVLAGVEPLGRQPAIEVSRRFDEITADGALGNGALASREIGDAIVEEALAGAAGFLERWLAG